MSLAKLIRIGSARTCVEKDFLIGGACSNFEELDCALKLFEKSGGNFSAGLSHTP